MQEKYSTLTEAITSVFRREGKSLLSLDHICQELAKPGLFLNTNSGVVECSTISRRRISSILSSSEIFVRAGPPRSCMWALRPSNPLFLSDGALITCINQILTEHGPLTAEEILEHGDLSSATPQILTEFLLSHPKEYELKTMLQEKGSDEVEEKLVWWFVNQPLPVRMVFDSVIHALLQAFDILDRDSSIEEISWVLCLSTLPQFKRISRRKISRELSRRPDLFTHISRAKYSLIKKSQSITPASTIPIPQLSANSSPNATPSPIPSFNIENSVPQKSFKITIPPSIKVQQSLPRNSYYLPYLEGKSNIEVQPIPIQEIENSFENMLEFTPKYDVMPEWHHVLPQCETPPVCGTDYFDPVAFFSVGFADTFE